MRGRIDTQATRSTVIIIALAIALIVAVGLFLLLRDGDDSPPADANGDDNLSENALGVDQSGRLPADFDYLILGISPTGHDYPFPNENRARKYHLAVKSQPSDDQLESVFGKDYVVSLGGDFYEGSPYKDLSFEYSKTRNIFISEIAVYDYYEGIGADYDAWWTNTYWAAFHGDEDDLDLEAGTRFEASWRQAYNYDIPPLPDYDQPLTSFGTGYYRVGPDISPGTYQAVIVADSENDKLAGDDDYDSRDYTAKYEGWLSYSLTPPARPLAEDPARPLDASLVRFKTSCSLFYSVDNPEVDNVEYPDGFDGTDPANPPVLVRYIGVDNIVSGSSLTITVGPHVTNLAIGAHEDDCGGATWRQLDQTPRT